jgi:hypothetical protein
LSHRHDARSTVGHDDSRPHPRVRGRALAAPAFVEQDHTHPGLAAQQAFQRGQHVRVAEAEAKGTNAIQVHQALIAASVCGRTIERVSEPDLPDLRVSDAEREEALSALGEHLSAGRLDINEFDDRSAKVTTARTRNELSALFADLPAPKPAFGAPALQPVPPVPAQRSSWQAIPGEFAGPIIGVAWVIALFIGPAIGANWMFGVALAVSIVVGSLTRESRWERRERRRMIRDEMRERRHELRRGDR